MAKKYQKIISFPRSRKPFVKVFVGKISESDVPEKLRDVEEPFMKVFVGKIREGRLRMR